MRLLHTLAHVQNDIAVSQFMKQEHFCSPNAQILRVKCAAVHE